MPSVVAGTSSTIIRTNLNSDVRYRKSQDDYTTNSFPNWSNTGVSAIGTTTAASTYFNAASINA